jgi:hypothetical protein
MHIRFGGNAMMSDAGEKAVMTNQYPHPVPPLTRRWVGIIVARLWWRA